MGTSENALGKIGGGALKLGDSALKLGGGASKLGGDTLKVGQKATKKLAGGLGGAFSELGKALGGEPGVRRTDDRRFK